jgi:hypothetical protein
MFRSLSSPLSAYEFPKSCNKCSLVVAVAAQCFYLPYWLQITPFPLSEPTISQRPSVMELDKDEPLEISCGLAIMYQHPRKCLNISEGHSCPSTVGSM